MAALNKCSRKRIRAEASCAVCDNFYTDPVQVQCGSSFCRACVAGRSPPLCPDCDAEFDPARLTPNRSLVRLVEIARQLLEREERRDSEASAREGAAAAGGEASRELEETVFCKQEKTLLCQPCYVPEEHPGHEVVPADEAAQEYKVHIRRCLVRLKEEEKDILLNKTTLEEDCQYSFTRAASTWEKTKTEFQRIEDFLEGQKKWLLAQGTEVYKEIKMNKNEQISALSKKQSFLRDVSCEMEEVRLLPGTELLENIGDVLRRFEERETVEHRGSLSLELQDKITGLIHYHMFLTGAMQHFRENVACEFNRHKGIPTPNPNGTEINASEEIQSVAPPSDPGSSGLQAE